MTMYARRRVHFSVMSRHSSLYHLIVILAPLVSATPSHADNNLWSRRYGDEQDQQVLGLAVDRVGNLAVVGFIEGSVDFGGGTLMSLGSRDAFVAKFDRNGNHLWSKRFGDANLQEASGVAFDEAGNVIAVGYIEGTVDFGGELLTSMGSQDAFVVKFDSQGEHLWSKRFGDALPQWSNAVAVDAAGKVAIAGVLSGTADFGGGILTSAGYLDVFIVQFDQLGNHVWSRSFGDAVRQEVWSIAVDSQANLVVAGDFEGTVNLGGSTLVCASHSDILLAKFDNDGHHIWSNDFGDESLQECHTVAVDNAGNILIAAYLSGMVDFGGGPLISAGGPSDICIAKFDPLGNHLWSQRFGDSFNQGPRGVAADPLGNIAVAGYVEGTVDFGGGALPGGVDKDVFVSKFTPGGSHLWSQRFGHSGDQVAMALDISMDGDIAVAGFFRDTLDFGHGPHGSSGAWDAFLAQFGLGSIGIEAQSWSALRGAYRK